MAGLLWAGTAGQRCRSLAGCVALLIMCTTALAHLLRAGIANCCSSHSCCIHHVLGIAPDGLQVTAKDEESKQCASQQECCLYVSDLDK